MPSSPEPQRTGQTPTGAEIPALASKSPRERRGEVVLYLTLEMDLDAAERLLGASEGNHGYLLPLGDEAAEFVERSLIGAGVPAEVVDVQAFVLEDDTHDQP
jgi:hypothetical protein